MSKETDMMMLQEIYQRAYDSGYEAAKSDIASSVKMIGDWIPANDNSVKSFKWICSECGKPAYDYPEGSRRNRKSKSCNLKYCPNCGVKMEVEIE